MKEKKRIDLGDVVITVGWMAVTIAAAIVTQDLVDKGTKAVRSAYHNYKDNSNK